MAAERAVNFQHIHRENNRKPRTHRALVMVKNGLNLRREMHVVEREQEIEAKWHMLSRWETLSVRKCIVH
jgi:hypothetical protein